MSKGFKFEILAQKGQARAGVLHTPHGQIATPIFMPVGTAASVKALDSADLLLLSAQIILANTYHLFLRPGLPTIEQLGGVHQLMNWSRPVLTDSGGYQVFSLGQAGQTARSGTLKPALISDEGVTFYSHLDGTAHHFDPQVSIQAQRVIGADIIMAFDECASDAAPIKQQRVSLERTHRWEQQSLEAWEVTDRLSVRGQYQALFGIIQGGDSRELRQHSAQFINQLPFDGIALGGETIGYQMAKSIAVCEWVWPHINEAKPRYTMGLGRDPADVVAAVWAGVDMMDCVGPTRLARNGALFCGELSIKRQQPVFSSDLPKGRLAIGSVKYRLDQRPVDPNCQCYTCRSGYTRAYLHHLYRCQELSYYRLASIHNLHFMIQLTSTLRSYILN